MEDEKKHKHEKEEKKPKPDTLSVDATDAPDSDPPVEGLPPDTH